MAAVDAAKQRTLHRSTAEKSGEREGRMRTGQRSSAMGDVGCTTLGCSATTTRLACCLHPHSAPTAQLLLTSNGHQYLKRARNYKSLKYLHEPKFVQGTA